MNKLITRGAAVLIVLLLACAAKPALAQWGESGTIDGSQGQINGSDMYNRNGLGDNDGDGVRNKDDVCPGEFGNDTSWRKLGCPVPEPPAQAPAPVQMPQQPVVAAPIPQPRPDYRPAVIYQQVVPVPPGYKAPSCNFSPTPRVQRVLVKEWWDNNTYHECIDG